MEMTSDHKKYLLHSFLWNSALLSACWIAVLLHQTGNDGFWSGLLHGSLAFMGFIIAIFGSVVVLAAMNFSKIEPFVMLHFTKNPAAFEKLRAWHENIPQVIDFLMDLAIIAPLCIAGWWWTAGYFVVNMLASQSTYEIYNQLKVKMKI